MSYDFNAQEIFKMAEQIERNGVAFYKKAAENATDPEAKKFLLFMSDIEAEHENVFASMRAELDADETEATFFDPEDENILYLHALADTKVFSNAKIDTSSMQDILETAIMAEKNAIAFYVGMQDLVPDKRGKERLDAIIKEEKSHIVLLTQKLQSVG